MAAELGAAGIQLDTRNELRPEEFSETGRRQFLHAVRELEISVASLVVPLRRSLVEQEELEVRVEAIKAAMQFAWDVKAPVVTARIGRIPAADSPEYALLLDVLNDLARHGNHVGSTFLVTPTWDTPQVLETLLGSITAGPIGIDFDPASFVMTGQNATDALRTLHRSVLHVLGRDGLREVDGGGVETPLGRGEVEWDEVLVLLGEMDYRGWVTVVRSQGDDKTADCARAIQYIRRIMQGG